VKQSEGRCFRVSAFNAAEREATGVWNRPFYTEKSAQLRQTNIERLDKFYRSRSEPIYSRIFEVIGSKNILCAPPPSVVIMFRRQLTLEASHSLIVSLASGGSVRVACAAGGRKI